MLIHVAIVLDELLTIQKKTTSDVTLQLIFFNAREKEGFFGSKLVSNISLMVKYRSNFTHKFWFSLNSSRLWRITIDQTPTLARLCLKTQRPK
jgi:hypothetical protein